MTAPSRIHEWDLWYPKAGATGMPFARGRMDPRQLLLVHAAPPVLTVVVRDGEGRVLAEGRDLEATRESPICKLQVAFPTITREDIWPTEQDLGCAVILAGGEIGILTSWWNAPDQSEWRWQIELYNHRG
jgi:hypothetical protein